MRPVESQALGAGARHLAHQARAGDQPALLGAALVLGEGVVAGQPDQRHPGDAGVDRRLLVGAAHEVHVEAVEREGRDEIEAPPPVVLEQQRRMAVGDGDLLQLAQPVADEAGAADLAAGDGERDVLAGELPVAPGVDRGQLAGELAQRHPAASAHARSVTWPGLVKVWRDAMAAALRWQGAFAAGFTNSYRSVYQELT